MKQQEIKSVVLTEYQYEQTGCTNGQELFECIKMWAELGVENKTQSSLNRIKAICKDILK